jgi:hypothetical protein
VTANRRKGPQPLSQRLDLKVEGSSPSRPIA